MTEPANLESSKRRFRDGIELLGTSLGAIGWIGGWARS